MNWTKLSLGNLGESFMSAVSEAPEDAVQLINLPQKTETGIIIRELPTILIVEEPLHPVFRPDDQLMVTRGLKEKRAAGIIYRTGGDEVMTIKYKGTDLINPEGFSDKVVTHRTDQGEYPGGLSYIHALREAQAANKLAKVIGIHNTTNIVGLEVFKEIAGLNIKNFIESIYFLPNQKQIVNPYVLKAFKEDPMYGPAQLIYEVNGYDLRVNELASLLCFDFNIRELNDIYYETIDITKKNKPGNIAGFRAGQQLLDLYSHTQNLSPNQIVYFVYNILNDSYNLNYFIPNNYLECSTQELIELMKSQVVEGKILLDYFISNEAKTLGLAHSHNIRFSINYPIGGAKMPRNTPLGTINSSPILDLITLQDDFSENDSVILAIKDFSETMLSIISMSRLVSKELWPGLLKQFKDSYFEVLRDNADSKTYEAISNGILHDVNHLKWAQVLQIA